MTRNPIPRPRMSDDAYAGFIRLLLTPLSQAPRPSEELDAYLRFLTEAERLEGTPGPWRGWAA